MYKNMTAKQYKALKMQSVVVVMPHMGDDSHKVRHTVKATDLTRVEKASPYIQAHNTGHVEYKK